MKVSMWKCNICGKLIISRYPDGHHTCLSCQAEIFTEQYAAQYIYPEMSMMFGSEHPEDN